MDAINIILPLASSALSFTFAILVMARYVKKRGLHQLLWGFGTIMYGVGGLAEALHGLIGFTAIGFRLWYLLGAMLVAAWLGQGTIYLLVKKSVAHVLMAILVAATIFGAVRVFGATLDPDLITESVHTGSELSGHAITSGGVRILTPFFNLYGTVALVGGAIWSAIVFFRKRILLHRTLGNLY